MDVNNIYKTTGPKYAGDYVRALHVLLYFVLSNNFHPRIHVYGSEWTYPIGPKLSGAGGMYSGRVHL